MNFIQIYSKNPLCTAAAVLSSHHFRYFVSALIAKVQECPQWNVTVGELICLLKNYRFPNATSGSNDFLIHHLPIGVDEIIDDHVWRTKKKKDKNSNTQLMDKCLQRLVWIVTHSFAHREIVL